MRRLLLACLVTAACVPPDAELFAPVHDQVRERVGVSARWQHRPAGARPVTGKLTLEEAIELAVENNAGLQASFTELGIGRGGLISARRPLDLELEGNMKWPVDGDGDPSVELELTQDLMGLGLAWARSRAASDELRAIRSEVVGAVVDLVADVKRAYYEVQASRRMLELREQIVASTEAAYDLSQRARAAGNITELELQQQRVLYEQARLDLRAVEADLAASRAQLEELLGAWGAELSWEVSGPLPDPPAAEASLDGLETESIERSLDLDGARWRLRSLARSASIAGTLRWLPRVGAGVAAEREEGAWALGPAIIVSLPLFGPAAGRVVTADAMLLQAQQEYAATAARIRARARAAAERLRAAREQAIFLRDVVVPLRERIVEETLLQYNAMQASPYTLLLAKELELQAQAQLVQVVAEYWRARADVDQLRAGRLLASRGASMTTAPMPAAEAPAEDH